MRLQVETSLCFSYRVRLCGSCFRLFLLSFFFLIGRVTSPVSAVLFLCFLSIVRFRRTRALNSLLTFAISSSISMVSYSSASLRAVLLRLFVELRPVFFPFLTGIFTVAMSAFVFSAVRSTTTGRGGVRCVGVFFLPRDLDNPVAFFTFVFLFDFRASPILSSLLTAASYASSSSIAACVPLSVLDAPWARIDLVRIVMRNPTKRCAAQRHKKMRCANIGHRTHGVLLLSKYCTVPIIL